MIFNDKLFDRDIEIKKCFENKDSSLIKYNEYGKKWVDCENPDFDETNILNIKSSSYCGNEYYVVIKNNFADPYEITYEKIPFVEMVNRRIENYAFKGTDEECDAFCNEFYNKYYEKYDFIHICFPDNDIKDFINKINIYGNIEYFQGKELNELYNLLFKNNDVWNKYKKELEEKDNTFNKDLIFHMKDDEN